MTAPMVLDGPMNREALRRTREAEPALSKHKTCSRQNALPPAPRSCRGMPVVDPANPALMPAHAATPSSPPVSARGLRSIRRTRFGRGKLRFQSKRCGSSRDRRRVRQSAGAHHLATLIELAGDDLEQRPVRPRRTSSARKADKAVRSGVASWPAKPQNRRKLARSSSDSARRTTERSFHTASSNARNRGSGGQPNSPFAQLEMSTSSRYSSGQSGIVADSSNDGPPQSDSLSTVGFFLTDNPTCHRPATTATMPCNQNVSRWLKRLAHRSHQSQFTGNCVLGPMLVKFTYTART